jgi:hypothetical protein
MKPTTNNPITTSDDDFGEFACFDTLDAVAAYMHHKYGEEMLRELLKLMSKWESTSSYGPREHLEDAAAELEKRHLDKPAAILREFALTARSGIDNVPDYWRGKEDYWQRNWITQRKMRTRELGREMRREKAERERQSQTNGHKPAHQRH